MPRRITEKQKRECVRIRTEQQLSAPKIARMVGIGNQSAYKILEGHPWVPHGKRSATRGLSWTPSDEDNLRRLWPVAEPADILAAFPGRTWAAMQRHASSLKIRRPLPGCRRNTRAIPSAFKQLRAERERQHLTRKYVAQKSGHHINQLLAWELGKAQPLFLAVNDWANALGLEIVIRLPAAAALDMVIPWPSKEKRMGAR